MRRRGLGTVLVGFGTTLAVILFNSSALGGWFWRQVFQRIEHQTHDVPHGWVVQLAWRVFHDLVHMAQDALAPWLAVATVAVLAGVVARGVAAARLRSGRGDPLERLRKRRWLVAALSMLPAVLIALPFVDPLSTRLRQMNDFGSLAAWMTAWIGGLLAVGITSGLGYAAGRTGMRGLLAPLETAAPQSAPKAAGDIVFSAVAVTRRTRGAVAAVGAASLAMVVWALAAPGAAAFPWALAAYVAAAMTAPFALQRVSRIAVGLDGVWVRDASRALFFAYRDLEGVRARGADLELVARGGRAALRLQMHGDDAGRRDEVLARVEDAIARSRAGDTRGAEMLVQAMPAGHVVASAGGDARYRMPSISRQQLWDLVESPATEAATRTAAAEALVAIPIDDADRARLRVAAEQCAEPRVRVALAELAGEEGEGDAAEAEAGRVSAGAG